MYLASIKSNWYTVRMPQLAIADVSYTVLGNYCVSFIV